MNIAIRAALDALQKQHDQIEAAITSLRLLDDIPPETDDRAQPTAVPITKKTAPARKAETKKTASAPGTKPCRKCGEVKALDQFCVNHTCRDGHTRECKKCATTRAKANYAARHKKPIGEATGKLNYECSACHARFATPIAKKNHNCVRAAAAGEF